MCKIGILINVTVGHSIFFFTDGLSTYNQIKLHMYDIEKIDFRTPMGNLLYSAMMFGLKNARATYQRAMTTVVIVKSK